MQNRHPYLQVLRQVARLLLPVLVALVSVALLSPAAGATDAPVPRWPRLSSQQQSVSLSEGMPISTTVELGTSWYSKENDNTQSVAWGDVDADGDLDLAVGNDGQPNKLYKNEGGRLIASASWQSSESDNTQSVAWADVDADGDLDLAVGNSGQPNKLYKNEGGTLTASASWQSNDNDDTQSVAWADVDADGDLDLAVGNDQQPNKLYKNEGGILTASASWQSHERDSTSSLAWADVDADGDLDLAVGNFGRNQLYENENGRLTTSASWQTNENDSTSSVAWADVDADGDLDLAIGNFGQANKLYQNEGGRLTHAVSWQSNESDRTSSIAWADVDADGDLDLAVGNFGQANKLYQNEGGRLAASASWQSNENRNTWSLAWADVDADGDLDLALGNDGQPNKLYQNESQRLTASAGWQSNDADDTQSVAWADVDADGDLDLAVGNDGQANKLYLNEGQILSPSASWQSNDNDRTISVAWGDVDADGDLDLAVGNDGQNKLYQNEGGRLIASASWQSNDNDRTVSVAWGDVDADGDLDLAVGNYFGQNKLYQNEGGRLTASASWQSNDNDRTRSVAWADVDADGDLDLAVGNYFGRNKLYKNEAGRLTASASWQSNESDKTSSVAWADVDADGDLDLAVGNEFQANKLYKNEQGTLTASASWQSNDSDDTQSVAWADVDADGDLDLAVGNDGQNKFYLNEQPAHLLHLNQTVTMNISPLALAPADFYATSDIRERFIPITYTLFHPASEPMREVRAFYSLDGGGRWLPAVASSDTITTNLSSTGSQHLYQWDVLASGFFGQSDNVIIRMEALPNLKPISNRIPGPFERPLVSAQTYPGRVRGSQVQVLSGTMPVKDALVYRLPAGQTSDAKPYANHAGEAFRTDMQGYLQGRGELAMGDQLLALHPITSTNDYTLYHTNATPTETGLESDIVQEKGVKELVVSGDHPLILFDLDISLEWDARNDPVFLEELQNALKRSSQVLYDVSNGQMALGEIRVYQAKENWLNADVALFASPDIHPSATLGGIVITPTNEIGVSGVLTNAYWPGQIRMGPSWDPFGLVALDLGEDWWRTLTHELGHYLLFLPDNYIGIENGLLKPTDCRGSFMTNTFDDSYSEFLNAAQWDDTTACQSTVAEYATGRSDWETITHFYPMLHDSPTNPGPSVLPLDVTQVTFVPPASASSRVLPARNFNLRDATSGALLLIPEGRGYLIKSQGSASDLSDDILINLGQTGGPGDRIMVRGADVGDRLCVSGEGWFGCEQITARGRSVYLSQAPDWQPNIQVTPLSPLTLAVTVTLQTPTTDLNVQVLPATAHPFTPTITYAPSAAMIATDPANPITFTQVITLTYPAFTGSVRVWSDSDSDSDRLAREAMSEYFLSIAAWAGNSGVWGGNSGVWGGNSGVWGGNSGVWGGDASAWGGNSSGWGAPMASGDGQVTVFNVSNPFGEPGISALQSLSNLPHLPAWFTVVGQGYRVTQDADLSESITRTISFDYLQRDVPGGYEFSLSIYYLPNDGTRYAWQQLPTDLDMSENLAVAVMPAEAEGIYALISKVEIELPSAGWNLFAYPVQATRPVSDALQSISGYYTTVYGYDASDSSDPWKLYDVTVPNWVNDLHELVYGRGYWINVSQPITLELPVDSDSPSARMSRPPARPPATYYGTVQAGQDFVPTAGMTLTAYVNGTLCAESQTESHNGEIVYQINVTGAGPDDNGCGTPERTVTLFIESQEMAPIMRWDNSQVHEVDLNPVQSVPTSVRQTGFTANTNTAPWTALALLATVVLVLLLRGYRETPKTRLQKFY